MFSRKEIVAIRTCPRANISQLMSAGWPADVAVVPLDPPRSMSLGIAVRSLAAATPAARRFVDCTQRVVREL